MFNIVIDKESITDNNSSSAEKTAEWRSYKDISGTHCYCSKCGHKEFAHTDHCEGCGAKMTIV